MWWHHGTHSHVKDYQNCKFLYNVSQRSIRFVRFENNILFFSVFAPKILVWIRRITGLSLFPRKSLDIFMNITSQLVEERKKDKMVGSHKSNREKPIKLEIQLQKLVEFSILFPSSGSYCLQKTRLCITLIQVLLRAFYWLNHLSFTYGKILLYHHGVQLDYRFR